MQKLIRESSKLKNCWVSRMIAEKLRKAVLQAAMEGKLTKQLDNDSSVYQLITEVHKIDNDDLWEIPKNGHGLNLVI